MLLGPFTAANYGLDFDDGTRNVTARSNVLYGTQTSINELSFSSSLPNRALSAQVGGTRIMRARTRTPRVISSCILSYLISLPTSTASRAAWRAMAPRRMARFLSTTCGALANPVRYSLMLETNRSQFSRLKTPSLCFANVPAVVHKLLCRRLPVCNSVVHEGSYFFNFNKSLPLGLLMLRTNSLTQNAISGLSSAN